jgi:ABC-type nickel/cobalt efflux system permease component RcnA
VTGSLAWLAGPHLTALTTWGGILTHLKTGGIELVEGCLDVAGFIFVCRGACWLVSKSIRTAWAAHPHQYDEDEDADLAEAIAHAREQQPGTNELLLATCQHLYPDAPAWPREETDQ